MKLNRGRQDGGATTPGGQAKEVFFTLQVYISQTFLMPQGIQKLMKYNLWLDRVCFWAPEGVRKAHFLLLVILGQAVQWRFEWVCLIIKCTHLILIIIFNQKMQRLEPEGYWVKHSDFIKQTGVNINEHLSPRNYIYINAGFKKYTSFGYCLSMQSQDILAFFKKHYTNKLGDEDFQGREIVCKIDTSKQIVAAAAIQAIVIAEYLFCFVMISATHYQKRKTGLQRRLLNECDRVLQAKAGEMELKGAFLIAKCLPALVAFYKKCNFDTATEPFRELWKEDGLVVMCRPIVLEGHDLKMWDVEPEAEAEKVPEQSAANSKEPVVRQTVSKKQIVAKATKKVKKQKEEKSTLLDYDSSSLSAITSDDDEVGLAPAQKAKKAKEEKPVQIDTSTIKVAATIKKTAKPRAEPQPKTMAVDDNTDSDEIMASDEELIKSQVQHTFDYHINKHCTAGNCDGKLISGKNWARHTECKHSNAVVSYRVCREASCDYCKQEPKPKAPRIIKYYTCASCDEERRYDRFPTGKDKSVCVYCIDGKSCRGSIKGLEKGTLKSALLDKLPQQTTQQQLNDSANDTDNDTIVASAGHSSSKRQKTVHVTATEPENIEFDIVKQLEVIESNGKSVFINALVVQDLCHKFNQDLILQFFTTGDHPNLLQCVFTVLTRLNSLSNVQFIGLLSAAFALGPKAWDNSKLALGQTDNEKRNSVLNQFKWVIQKQYGERVANWCCIYWNYLNKDQFAILEALKQSPQAADDSILMISLCSETCEVYEYIKLISSFVRNAQPAFQLLHNNIKTNPKQIKTTFTTFIELTQVLQDTRNVAAIESIKESLLQIPVAKWKEQIELAHATSTVIDGDSIQKSLDEFIAKYGKPSESKLATDLSLSGNVHLKFFTKAVLNPPNYKQFATAQYCLGQFKNHQRQMWCVPSGQGKGRIEHTLAVFALLLGFSKVYIFYPSKQLYDRDIAEFSTYLKFVKKDQIQYCIGMDGIVVGDNELAIFDEGDAIMHNDPDKFRDFVSKCLCVCFTATPDDQDPRGVDIQVLTAMTFSTFYYVLDVLERIIKFDFDLELPAMPVIEKAAEVKRLSQTGPVVVHCVPALYDELKKLDLELVEADENVSHHTLKTLGVKVNNKFRVAVALTTAAMRGLDYRSSVDGILISLLLAKSFENKREAMQGYYRVGRFNDKCYRVAFKDVDLVDPVAELSYRLNALNFLNTLSAKTVQMKHVTVTDLSGLSKKPTTAANKTKGKKETTGQSKKAQYQANMTRKRQYALVPPPEVKQGHIEQASAQPLE